MLHEAHESPGAATAADLLDAYAAALRSVVDDRGPAAVANATGLDVATVEAVGNGDAGDLTLTEAAEVLALADEAPDADAIEAEARDHLLLGMTTGILDVDTVAAEIEADLTAKEVQQALEGRTPVTLAQFAAIQSYIESRQR